MTAAHWPTPEALERARRSWLALHPAAPGPEPPSAESPSPSRRGCGWCGIASSARWHGSSWQWPDGVAAFLCVDCYRRWHSARCHRGNPWRPQLAAEAAGLYLAPLDIAEIVPFVASDPPDRRGTLERFAYLHPEDRC